MLSETDTTKVNAHELLVEIQGEWKAAQEAGSNAVLRAQQLLSPNSRSEIETLRAERIKLEKRLADAKQRIKAMEEIVDRFAAVQDPVVASDGFTYDRAQITAYVTECRNHGQAAISQQSHQELTERFIPNNSLKRLIEVLRPLLEAPVAAPTIPVAVAPIG